MSKNILSVRFVADTPEKREKGLMFAQPLQDDEAVLFVFPSNGRYAFWNHNVSFGLSLAFLNNEGKVLDLKDMDAQSREHVEPSSSDIKYVVEAKQGVFQRLGVEKGDLIKYEDHQLRIKTAQKKKFILLSE